MKLTGPSPVRIIIVIMVAVVLTGILIARSYYANINRSVDPRIAKARELYSDYNDLARTGDYYGIFALLDSIEQIYDATPHYRGSFEMGVLDNNRAAALLTLALYTDSIPLASNPFPELPVDSLVSLAGTYCRRAIATYTTWNDKYEGKSAKQIHQIVKPGFSTGLESADEKQLEKYLRTRIGEIEEALHENRRRLSVSHTNLGLVFRQQGDYEHAVRQYEKALLMWDRNLDAENNLNRLLNRPLKKRNLIQKLFPPKRETYQDKNNMDEQSY